jgi:hypothetical protein
MILKVGSIENYNNNILIVTLGMKPGTNDINNKKNIPLPLMKGRPVMISKSKANLTKVTPEVTPVTPVEPEVKPKKEAKKEVKLEDHENM